MNYKTDTIIDLAEDYIDDYYDGEYNHISRNGYSHPSEFMLHLKFPRQSGHTTALKYLDEKYNCYIIGKNKSMLEDFNIRYKSNQQYAIIGSDNLDKYRGLRSIIKPHVILIENYSLCDQSWINNYITEYFMVVGQITNSKVSCPIIGVN